MKAIVVAALLLGVTSGFACAQGSGLSPGTPPPATNQCWDTTRNELRDKTSATIAKRTGETGIGRDRSAGPPAPASGNSAGSGTARTQDARRPPGVTNC